MSKPKSIGRVILDNLKSMPSRSEANQIIHDNINPDKDTDFGGGTFQGAGAYARFSREVPYEERVRKSLLKKNRGSVEFQKAFKAARDKGLKEFNFNGKTYNTGLDDTPDVVVREVGKSRNNGATFISNPDSTSVEPYVGQRLGTMKREEEYNSDNIDVKSLQVLNNIITKKKKKQ